MAIENSTRRTGQNEGQRTGSFYPANTLSGSRFTESDSDDDSSDTSSVLTQIGNDEFPSHFIEREGRLFHSHGSLPYPLPVDGEEQAVRVFFCFFAVPSTSFMDTHTEIEFAAQDSAGLTGFTCGRTRRQGTGFRAEKAKARSRPWLGDRSMVRN